MKSKAPNCPIHVSVSMKEASSTFTKGTRYGKKKVGRKYFRCPIQGCSRVQLGINGDPGPVFFGWFGADCLT